MTASGRTWPYDSSHESRGIGGFCSVGRTPDRGVAEQIQKLRNTKDKGLHEIHHASP